MRFKMSTNIAVPTTQGNAAADFYTNVLGFKDRSDGSEFAELDADPITIFVTEDDELRGPVLELFVDDLDQARQELEANGCKVIRWRGKGQDCYIEDPFGVIYNIWEE